MYGVEFLRTFDPEDEEHKSRKHRLFELPSGPKLLPDAFDCILARVSFIAKPSVSIAEVPDRESKLKSLRCSVGNTARRSLTFPLCRSSRLRFGVIAEAILYRNGSSGMQASIA